MVVRLADGVGVNVEAAVKVEVGDIVAEPAGGVQVWRVVPDVGVRVSVEAGKFASAMESEKPPRTRKMETSAMITPRMACRRLFIAVSPPAAQPAPASGR